MWPKRVRRAQVDGAAGAAFDFYIWSLDRFVRALRGEIPPIGAPEGSSLETLCGGRAQGPVRPVHSGP